MMSKKQWSALLCLHISYLFLGATLYYNIENPLEVADMEERRRERFQILDLLHKNYAPSNPEAQSDIISRLSDYCIRLMTNTSASEEPGPRWDFYHSFFFSYTVISTVGYGNLAPSTAFGRIIMIFYAIVGIPINAILITNLGSYFGKTFQGLYERYKLRNPKSGSHIDSQMNRFGLFGRIVLYLLPGLIIFIFFPAYLFTIFEDWDWALAIYYAFVTLSTIGFGDHVASFEGKDYGWYTIAYRTFLIFWITFGLGYLLMVVGYLTQGLKSKKILQLEHMVAQNLKQTQSKIWNNVTKDVGYLRNMLNEIYMMRFKPVYHDEIIPPRFHRSSSCPSLTFSKDETPKSGRKRAYSECIPKEQPEIQRVQSETDLLAIDRDKTFAVSTIVQPAELLAKVVGALGHLQNEDSIILEDEGIHGFSDDEILASERAGSTWSMGGDMMYATPPRIPRARAASEIRVTNTERPDKYYNNNEWTWSSSVSSGKMREIMMARRMGKLSVPSVSTSMKSNIDKIAPEPEKSFISKLNPFKKSPPKPDETDNKNYDETMTPAEYLRKTARGRISLAPNLHQKYLNKTKNGRPSVISLQHNKEEILENTTIADLIRALTALHSADANLPQRKMGTASLTPPSSTFNISGSTNSNSTLGRDTRRFSVHPAMPTPFLERRQSGAHLPPAVARRRFSLHPSSSSGSSYTPKMSPLATSSTTSQQRRDSLVMPPPYTPYESPNSGLGRRRLSSAGARRSSPLNNPATPSDTPPNLRPRRPFFRIVEGYTSPQRRIQHGSLTDIRIDELNTRKS